MIIDLRSDTVTRPTAGMLNTMFHAEVGDDVMQEDPTINALEAKAAQLFGKQAGLFCSSGTMANQIAVKVHTHPGDEVILHKHAHIYYYEGGGMMVNSGVSPCLLDGDRGRLNVADIAGHLNPPDDVHRPLTRLVAVENTMNKGGGSVYSPVDLVEIGNFCREHNLKYHLDGARIFNALTVTGQSTFDAGAPFDTVSVCLSKGLGAPVGSLLLGDEETIYRARRIRKILGGGMRQAGYLAAAGIYALDNHVDRLVEDHKRAKILAETLEELPWVHEVVPAETNILLFRVTEPLNADLTVKKLEENGILCFSFDKYTVRFVTHLDFTDEHLYEAIERLKKIVF